MDYTTKEAARLLGISPGRVRKMLIDGVATGRKHGRDWSISDKEVERLIKLERPAHRPRKAEQMKQPQPVVTDNPFRTKPSDKSSFGCLKQKYYYDPDGRVYTKVKYAGAVRSVKVVKPDGTGWTKTDRPKKETD